MKNNYCPKKLSKIIKGVTYIDKHTFVNFKKSKKFHVGQSYDKDTAMTAVCKVCGGKEFNVGQSEHFTAIRCVKCKWEVEVHEG